MCECSDPAVMRSQFGTKLEDKAIIVRANGRTCERKYYGRDEDATSSSGAKKDAKDPRIYLQNVKAGLHNQLSLCETVPPLPHALFTWRATYQYLSYRSSAQCCCLQR